MKIQSSAATYMPPPTTQRANIQNSFKDALASAEATQSNNNATPAKRADLTHMTPMQMFDWMNEQLRTGKMTFDESTPFLGMTIGAETNNSPVNYLEKIKGGIEAAIWRGHAESKAMWEMALEVAERYQYQNTGISTFA